MSEWKLKKISLEFVKGYTYNKTEDRYEGRIEFMNNEYESFSVKVTDDMSEPYLKLIAGEVVKNAQQLADKLEKSLVNKQQEQ
jgi:hypothetical protein